jgi:hypothetical protein
MDFLGLIKAKRAQLGYACRDFAAELGLKPSVWNRMENGIDLLPDHIVPTVFAKLSLRPDELQQFRQSYSTYQLPARPPLTDAQLVEKLPMVFRKADGSKMSGNELLKLAERLKRELA